MRYILFLLLACCVCGLQAQTPAASSQAETNAHLLFNSRFYTLEDHWVVFPKNEKTGKYSFGFIYVDNMAGYTFDLELNFSLNDQGQATRDSADLIKTASYKYRLGPNTKPVAALPDDMLAALKVKSEPEWLHIYHPKNQDRSSVAMKVMYGKHLNSAGGINEALVYLESAYKTDPHADGLEFELTYSYNELKQYNKAIQILKAAIANKPDNPMFYRELGYAYMKSNDLDNAIKAYTEGIGICQPRDSEAKGEMAWNMAVIYRDQKHDTEQYKKWGQSAKEWAPSGTQLGQQLKNVVFN